MAQKKALYRHHPLRPLHGSRSFDKFIFWRKNSSDGFTLVELLVVIAVLSLVAGAVFVLLDPFAQIQKARDAQRKADLSQIQKVLEQYYSDNGRYPYSTGIDGFFSDCPGSAGPGREYRISATSATSGCVDWGTTWNAYSTRLPRDPYSANKYVYSVSSDGQTYYLHAHLERGYRDAQNCCPANNQTSSCGCPHALGVDQSAGDLEGKYVCASNGAWQNPLDSETCNYGVSSPNTSVN